MTAISRYVDVAKAHGLTPCELALAWCDNVEGITSTIIGATSMTQLKENIAAFAAPLSEEAKTDIAEVLKQYPAPF